MRSSSLFFVISLNMILFTAYGAQTLAQVQLRSQQALRITYASSSWNQDSSKIDSAYLFVREASSHRFARILLQETEPDSAIFSGHFSLDLGTGQELALEVYVPPPHLRLGEAQLEQFYQMIQQGQVPRRPVVKRVDSRGLYLVEVYDSKEQAERAIKALKRQSQLEQQARLAQKALEEEAQVPEATRQNAEEERRKRELQRLANETTLRQLERLRLEQLEQQRAEERARKSQALRQEERRQRKVQAARLTETALQHYRAGEFVQAEELFAQVLELDSEDKSQVFRYGVSLYRNGKLEEALVQLKMAEVEGSRARERDYYLGLIHYRLQEYEPALENFTQVRQEKDNVLYPSSAFYMGLIYFGYENFEVAREAFEQVIESSKDPSLDQQAEDYIQNIARALQFKKKQEKPWSISGTAGLMYDSNVLLAPDLAFAQGAVQDESFRWLGEGELDYRAIYQQRHEWTLRLSAFGLYSWESEVANADPSLVNFSLPYLYKSTLGKKGWQLGLTPGFEVLFMDPLKNGQQENILNSPYLGITNTFTMSPEWFAAYNLELRQDFSRLQASIGDDDASALMIRLSTHQTRLLDPSGRRLIVGRLGAVLNQAEGKNKIYQRYELGATYLRPAFWNSLWSFGLSAYQLHFPKAESRRDDTNVTANTSLSKPIREWLTWSLNASFTNNKSTSENNNYDKFTIMSVLSFDQIF